MKRRPPQWILELPAGIYDTDEIKAISNRTGPTIKSMMKKYGARIEQVPSGYRNLVKNVYYWSGKPLTK